jgi:hypothetical protein
MPHLLSLLLGLFLLLPKLLLPGLLQLARRSSLRQPHTPSLVVLVLENMLAVSVTCIGLFWS